MTISRVRSWPPRTTAPSRAATPASANVTNNQVEPCAPTGARNPVKAACTNRRVLKFLPYDDMPNPLPQRSGGRSAAWTLGLRTTCSLAPVEPQVAELRGHLRQPVRPLEGHHVRAEREPLAGDRFRPGELLQPVLAVDPPEAGVADAAERQRREPGERQHRVDAGHAAADTAGGVVRTLLAEDGSAETVRRPVGLVDRLVHGCDAADGQHRSERLLAHHPRIVGNVDEHDRVDVGSAHTLAAAHDRSGATLEGIIDMRYHHVDLLGHRHRTERRTLTGVHRLSRFHDLVDELVVDGVDDIDPLDTDAGLAGIGTPAPHRRARSGTHVRVVVDEQSIVAAELEHDRPQRLRAGRHDLAAGRRGTGERQLVDTGPAQGGTRLTETGDDLEHRLLGHPLPERVGEEDPDGRGVLARLEHDGVAGRERIDDRAHRREDGIVPRTDHADDAERLVLEYGRDVREHHRPADPARLHDLLCVLRSPGEMLEGEDVLDEGVDLRLPVLARDQVEQLLTAASEHAREAHQPLLAAVGAEALPPLRRLAGALNGLAYLAVVVHREGADDLAGRGGEGVERLLAAGAGAILGNGH